MTAKYITIDDCARPSEPIHWPSLMQLFFFRQSRSTIPTMMVEQLFFNYSCMRECNPMLGLRMVWVVLLGTFTFVALVTLIWSFQRLLETQYGLLEIVSLQCWYFAAEVDDCARPSDPFPWPSLIQLLIFRQRRYQETWTWWLSNALFFNYPACRNVILG